MAPEDWTPGSAVLYKEPTEVASNAGGGLRKFVRVAPVDKADNESL